MNRYATSNLRTPKTRCPLQSSRQADRAQGSDRSNYKTEENVSGLREAQAENACSLHRTSGKPWMEGLRMATSSSDGEGRPNDVLGLAGEGERRHAKEIVRRTAKSWEITCR